MLIKNVEPKLAAGVFLFALLAFAGRSQLAAAADIDVWIDPGHGGSDPGATGFNQVSPYPEKQANLEVSQDLGSALNSNGYSSLMIRNSDLFPTLKQRVGIGNGLATNDLGQLATAQIFVSIHMNSSESASPLGTEVYYSRARAGPKLANEYVQDKNLADVVYNDLIQNTPLAFMGCNMNRGVISAKKYVTRWPYIPSILVECCFISNQCQQGRIRQNANQVLVASGIASGITFFIFPGGELGDAPASRAAKDLIAKSFQTSATGEPWFFGTPGVIHSLGESFDGETFPPTGWTMTTAGQALPYRWARITDPDFVKSGVGSAVVRGESPGAVDEWLITPTFFLDPTDRGLSFSWLGNKTWSAQVNAKCLVRPVGAGSWTEIWSLAGEIPGQEFAYPTRALDISPWIGDSVQIAFQVVGTNGADFALDDVTVGDFPPGPVAPLNETCATALPLPLGQFEFSGSTCTAADDIDPHTTNPLGCAIDEMSGGDVVYSFSAQAGDLIDVNVAGDWHAAVYLMSACDTAASSCIAISSMLELSDTSSVASLSHTFSTGGAYYLVLDGIAGECGTFHLTGQHVRDVTAVPPGGSASAEARLTVMPNPSRGPVMLSCVLPRSDAGPTAITVFDAAGRRVWQTTHEGNSERFSLLWDGRSQSGKRVPSGAYIVRAKAGGMVATTSVVRVE